jgi:hypothetical protein
VCDFTDSNPATLAEYAQEIIDIARMFEAYSCGDLDAAAAEELMTDKG